MTYPFARLAADRIADEGRLCNFGIISGPLAGILAGVLPEAVAGPIAGAVTAGALGAGVGAGISGIEGKPLGQGALFGGLTGGAVGGLGPLIGSGISGATGLSAGTAGTIGDVAAGAGVGALAGPLTGQSPLSGTIAGGGAGLAAGVTGLSGTSGGPAAGAGNVAAGAGGAASPSGAASPGPIGLPSAAAGSAGATPLDLSSSDFSSMLNAAPDTSGLNSGLISATPVAAGASSAASPNFISNLFGYFQNNPAMLLGAGALGADLLMGNQPLPAQGQVQQAAADQASVGRTLSAYGESGTLPAGLQDVINMNTQAGEAALNSQFGQLGLANSTMAAQGQQQIREAAAGQQAQLANQLLQQGAQYTGMSNQELNTLLQTQMQQDQALTQAIGGFAGALAGSSLRPNNYNPYSSTVP